MPLPNRYMHVAPGNNPPEEINAIVEIPKGRRSKFEVDKKTGLMKLPLFKQEVGIYVAQCILCICVCI